jgi:hypothetical protein
MPWVMHGGDRQQTPDIDSTRHRLNSKKPQNQQEEKGETKKEKGEENQQ